MRKMTQRFIAVLLALCAVTAFAIEESANNKGMYIQRTIHPDDDASQGFLQRGGVAVTPETPTSNAPYTVAFWMRRKADNLALTSPTGGVGLAMAAIDSAGTDHTIVQSADLPDDEEWHYFVIQYDGTGKAWVYRDAALLGQIGNSSFDKYRFGYGCLGTRYVYWDFLEVLRGDYKGPTVFSTIVDDFSIWNTNSPAVLQIHNDIFKYGMRAMPDTHPNRLYYFSCDSAVDALQYFEDQFLAGHPSLTGDNRAYGATRSTAAFIDANVLKGVTNKPIQWVRMTVESDYGPDKVDPVVQTAVDWDYQQQVTFTAPASVYLDRYFNELTVTPGNEDAIEKMAYYRADCIGYDVDGPQFQGDGSLTSFVATLTDDITIVWKWELKYLVGVDSATGSHADGGLDPGVGSPSPQVGFGFEKASSDGGPARVGSIDGSIGGISVPVRFKSRGYILENTPGATDRSFVLGAGGDYLSLDDNLGHFLGGTRTDFTVDFWARRDPVGATADQAVVSIGDPANGGFQIGFEKNSETGNGFGGNAFYVKNLKTNFHVTAPEAFSDHEWHHWAVVWVRDGAGSGDLRIYRDGGLVVGTNETDAPKIYLANGSGFMTIGRRIHAGEPFSGGVNNLRIWDTERTSTQIEASMETESYGDDQSGELVVELGFDTPNLTAVTSTEGRSLTFTLLGFSGIFPAERTDAQKEATLFPGFIYVPSASTIPPPRVQTPTNAMDDWWRVTWLWEKQHRLDIAAIDPVTQGVQFVDMPFVRGDAVFDGVSNQNNELWVNDGTVLDIGSFYRTTNDCFTLRDVLVSSGSLDGITWNTLLDGSLDTRTTRQLNSVTVTGPGSVIWQYDKTVFRAEVPIGQYLDLATANAQLVPNLCNGGVLDAKGWDRVIESTPDTSQIKSVGNNADALLFDTVRQRVWPVQPGRFRVEWGDANTEDSYIIEIIADFPGNPVDLKPYRYWREDDAGQREGSAPDYVTETTMAPVTDAFPASPRAHYNHLARAADQPPTNLDLSATDRWKFDRFTIGTAAGTEVSPESFTAIAAGRSVLVWTYAETADATANGDVNAEGYLVRVVESTLTANRTQSDDQLSGRRRQILVPNDLGHVLIGTAEGEGAPNDLVFAAGDSFTIEFWSRKTVTVVQSQMPVIACTFDGGSGFEIGYSTSVRDRFGIRFGNTILVGPFVGDNNWHHWAMVHDGVGGMVRLYRDGSLGAEFASAGILPGAPQAATIRIGSTASGQVFHGEIDNVRIWGEALDPDELHEAMTTDEPALSAGSAPEALFAATFDAPSFGGTLRYSEPLPAQRFSFEDNYVGPAQYVIPDGDSQGVAVPIAVSGVPGPIRKVTLSIDGETCSAAAGATSNGINHSKVSDLSIYLNSPEDNVEVMFWEGGDSANICNLTFDAAAPTGIGFAGPFTAPLTGSYQSVTSLDPFIGTDPNGEWRVQVTDWKGNGHVGDVRGFTVNISGSGPWQSLYDGDGKPKSATLVRLSTHDSYPEVAARIRSKFDTSGFGSGYILNEVSNYNAQIYHRGAGIGEWGAIYPTNWSGLFTDANRLLDVAYYENPYRSLPLDILHPNVDWPYWVVRYDNVDFPDQFATHTAQTDNRIYIASRLGSEGVSNDGVQQRIFDPSLYDGLTVYSQPDRAAAGFNPNEEHAVVYDSIRAFLTGTAAANVKPKAAFALQDGGLNQTTRSAAATYSSDPWVLVQYQNRATNAVEMAAYKVAQTRTGSQLFPQLDPTTHSPKDALGQPVAQPTDPTYDFDYPIFAGDTVLPPYPLTAVVGATNLGAYNVGGNIEVDHDDNPASAAIPQRTVWKDIHRNNWCVSGNGRFFFQNWYPLRSDFWFDEDGDGDGRSDLATSTPIAWLSTTGEYLDPAAAPGADPVKVRYSSYWGDDYPILKRGETVTFAGGENKAENVDAEGLPAVLAWSSGQLVYDDRTPTMAVDDDNVDDFTARLIRPLDRHEAPFTQLQMKAATDADGAGLDPAQTDKVLVIGARWYFKALDGSLQKRFYYDSLLSKLVFRGRVNDKEGGDPDLTQTPISLSVLEPNVMTQSEYLKLRDLSDNNEWRQAVQAIYDATQNPHDVAGVTPGDAGSAKVFWAGVQDKTAELVGQYGFYTETDANGVDTPGTSITETAAANTETFQHLNSLGVGAALVPNPALLAADPDLDGDGEPDPLYVTLAENNHPDAGGAISVHIIEIGPARYRGAIKMIEAQNVFDEKINLQHTGDFGANTDDVYYQWWRREVVPLDEAGLPVDEPEWQVLEQGLGRHKVEVAGNPAVMLADQLFYVRYGERSEFVELADDRDNGTVADANWRLVDFEGDTWLKTVDDPEVPYQYAGASNSPQLQADGSKRYIPQLAMGWVKRILDRINPYEARYTDFYGNESPATYSSQLQIAGGPFNGKVALNADKDVIENVGLIELYETILERAKELTLDVGFATEGTNQALLLAATRLSVLYELLAREAYSDAQNPTVPVTTDNGIAGAGGYVHAFQNQEADLLHEELALLRGTDFAKASPAYNRLFWNYVKGLGEAAYNAVYNIHDENEDGFINEFDAAKLYPQGHGDAWGHFLSASKKHYDLLTNDSFSWQSRAELYSLLDNVIEADYLDEKTFARLAAAKARSGMEIVKATYREAYTEDPDGQWQGYTDVADPARAWGVSEWGKRTGMAAYFDWVAGNAIVPSDADAAAGDAQENLHDIDRRANVAELGEVAAAYTTIQGTIDDANAGHNPLGFDSDAIAFDIDPRQFDQLGAPGWSDGRRTHFEQIYARAITALKNADATLSHASGIDNQIRSIANDTRALQIAALRQDIDYRNRLIEVFGTPHDGKIGPGQLYAEGYTGPDSLLYMYVDRNQVADVTPQSDPVFTKLFAAESLNSIQSLANTYSNIDFDLKFAASLANDTPSEIFSSYSLPSPARSIDANSLRVARTGAFAFIAEDEDGSSWGTRGAYGEIQMTISAMLAEEVALRRSVADYEAYLRSMLLQWERVETQLKVQVARQASRRVAGAQLLTGLTAQKLGVAVSGHLKSTRDVALAALTAAEIAPPAVVGFSNDATSAVRVSLRLPKVAIKGASGALSTAAKIAEAAGSALIAIAEAGKTSDSSSLNELLELSELIKAFSEMVTREESLRLAIAEHEQRFNMLLERLQTEKAEGFRLLDEREAFNMVIAASAQRNRYGDMIGRITRNESLTAYQAAYENALKFAWLAAKAYDYETSLDSSDPAAATTLFDRLIKTRNIGLLVDGQPQIGQGGIAEILARMEANFSVLKGQLGINNPQLEVGRLSVRRELMRIGSGSASDARWRGTLQSSQLDDLWQLAEFRQYCRPFADPSAGAQPGIVISFGTEIESGFNVFGNPLAGGDHAYSSANYATKVRSIGVWFENYNDAGLATTPRVYLVPVGLDVLRLANSQYPTTRTWNVVEQKIPVPFLINTEQLGATNFLPKVHTINGSFAALRRFGDFRAYHDSGGEQVDMDQMISDSRLIGRSVWNTRWLLIIPGATLHADADYGIEQFIASVRDVRLQFETYSHTGN